MGNSFLGCRVRVERIGRDCELEISKILLMVDPRGGWGSHLAECGCTVTLRRVGCGCMV